MQAPSRAERLAQNAAAAADVENAQVLQAVELLRIAVKALAGRSRGYRQAAPD
jgi:hypothetical protein